MTITPSVQIAYKNALSARLSAHAPYSRFLVGACFKVRGQDKYVSGCNVENASFGATVCAERVAVWKWVSEKSKEEALEFVVLVTDTSHPVATPCGQCLQVMSEFVSADFPVHLANLEGVQKTVLFKELLPMTFSLEPSK